MGDVGPPPTPPRQERAPAPRTRRGRDDAAGPAAPANPYGDLELEVLSCIGLCCFLGALLACNVTSAAAMAVRRAYGRYSRAAAAAEETFLVSVGCLLYFGFLALLGHVLKRRYQSIGGGRDRNRPAANQRRPLAGNVRRARGGQEALYGPITRSIHLMSCALMAVGLVTIILAPARSYEKKVGNLIGEIGWLLHAVAFCFIICAAISVQWRSTCAKFKQD
ncbi:unnamed protein product [Urochloa decumbens]|uniref:Uncharacterized protein n=1 Tax=Urochloa decumbens TaxID=240449 RepID=A0ABC9C1C0_9POAL